MDTKFSWRNASQAAMLVIAAAYIAFSSTSNFPDSGVWKTVGIVFAVCLFLGTIIWHFVEMQTTIDKFNNNRPNLEFTKAIIKQLQMTEYHHKGDSSKRLYMGTATVTETYTAPLRAVGSTGDYEPFTEPYSVALVYIENKKLENRTIITSLNTHAKMFFYDENAHPIHEDVDARWADTIEPTFGWLEPKERRYYIEIDIPAGLEKELCVVAKQKNDENCYIYNFETYSENRLRRNESLLLKGKMFVKIVVRNANVTSDVVQWYELYNPGSGSDITFTPIQKPSKGRR